MTKTIEEILYKLTEFYATSADGGQTLSQATKDLERLIVEAEERGFDKAFDWWTKHKDDPTPDNIGIIKLQLRKELK